jgi:glutamate racemase
VVAHKLKFILEKEGLTSEKRQGNDVFYVSDYTKSFEHTTNIFYGKEIHLDLCKLR